MVLLASLGPVPCVAQTEYYNLDASRPLRVEDALPSERRSLDIELAPLRFESVGGNARRWRVDPKVAYGVAPLTEIELRVPLLYVQPSAPGSRSTAGLSSIGLSAMHAFNTESAVLPALAIGGDLLLPVGSMGAPNGSFAVKGLLTKTTRLLRVSVNGSIGTFSVIRPAAPPPACGASGAPSCAPPPPPIPDVPCDRLPVLTSAAPAAQPIAPRSVAPRLSAACLTSAAAAVPVTLRSAGTRWFAGAAIDHALVMSSTLVAADIFAERLVGFSPFVDWTAGVGLRHQWSPRLVLDAGASRKFAGTLQSTAFTLGATYSIAMTRPRT